jgi:hypothetical protein
MEWVSFAVVEELHSIHRVVEVKSRWVVEP